MAGNREVEDRCGCLTEPLTKAFIKRGGVLVLRFVGFGSVGVGL